MGDKDDYHTVYYDAMSKAVNPYGDGLACGRIVEFLNQRK